MLSGSCPQAPLLQSSWLRLSGGHRVCAAQHWLAPAHVNCYRGSLPAKRCSGLLVSIKTFYPSIHIQFLFPKGKISYR